MSRRLTLEQSARARQLTQDWIKIGLSTDRVDRDAAEAAVRRVYEVNRLTPPRHMHWYDSPLNSNDDRFRDLIGGSTYAYSNSYLAWRKQVAQWFRIKGRNAFSYDAHIETSPLWTALSQLNRIESGHPYLGSAKVNPWITAYDLAIIRTNFDMLGGELPAKFIALEDAVRLTGIWFPMPDYVVLTDRPTAIHWDAQGRLHHETGQALSYADGTGKYVWHGVEVPGSLIKGDGWTPDRILAERNVEVRRCAIERRGWDRFVDDIGLTPIADPVPDPGNPGHVIRLYSVPEAFYNEWVNVVIVDNASPDRDGTRRRFGLTVPGRIKDPIAAVAWTFGISAKQYAQLERAT